MNNKKLIRKSIFVGATLSLLCTASSLSFAKEYYKWVDSKGTTHYTTTPPPKSAKSRGKIDTYGYRSVTPTQQQQSPSSNTTNPAEQAPQTNSTSNQTQPSTMDAQQREGNAALQSGAVERPELR